MSIALFKGQYRMNDCQQRLEQCFAVVFPKLLPSEIPQASVASLAAWDSLAMATLLSVIEEEFAVPIPNGEIDHFVSFRSILNYLQANSETLSRRSQ